MLRNSLFLLFFFTLFMGCSHQLGREREQKGRFLEKLRLPSSSEELGQGCRQLLFPFIDDRDFLASSQWSPESLAERELMDLSDFDNFKRDKEWQAFISRSNQTDEEREMGFVILSLLKKKYPGLGPQRLRDRYGVLMAFCGGR